MIFQSFYCLLCLACGVRAWSSVSDPISAWARAAWSLRPARLPPVARSSVNLYVAVGRGMESLSTVLPDGWTQSGHQAVLALDLYPRANFGHPVLLFLMNQPVEESLCHRRGGRSVDNLQCVTLVCRNQSVSEKERMCQEDFLPLVTTASEPPNQNNQKLNCRDDVPGFSTCPSFRSRQETERLLCDHLRSNADRCNRRMGWARCRTLERCGYAFLLSGGWNRQTAGTTYLDNVRSVYSVLRRNGFRRDNIRIFYANGALPHTVSRENVWLSPSSLKSDFRFRLKRLCKSACADSLVLYLNSPTTINGSSLLWDTNGDGRVEEDETYSSDELMSDLDNCRAGQVYVLADQNYSGLLVRRFSTSTRHRNVQIFASSSDHQLSWNSDFTRYWMQSLSMPVCLSQIHQTSRQDILTSDPTFFDGSKGSINKTLSGWACHITPTVAYRGCRSALI